MTVAKVEFVPCNKPVICGIDYSMNCPAVCVLGSSFEKSQLHYRIETEKYIGKFKPNIVGHWLKPYKSEIERYEAGANWVLSIIPTDNCIVFLEDYSMGSRGKVFHIAENTGILKYRIYKQHHIEIKVVAPKTIKKFGTGNGNADKIKMHEAFVKLTGYNLHEKLSPDKQLGTSPVSDIVDAYFLALYGRSLQNEQ